MNLAILVGLAVDYVVHLAEGYHLSVNDDRRGRVRDMLESLGMSVLWGALTTLGAAFFMLFAKLQFFLQFGTCLFCTIGFSLLYSIVFFSTVMAMVGPEGEFGSLLPVFRYIRRKITGRTITDVDCGACSGKGFLPTTHGQPEVNGVVRETAAVHTNETFLTDLETETGSTELEETKAQNVVK